MVLLRQGLYWSLDAVATAATAAAVYAARDVLIRVLIAYGPAGWRGSFTVASPTNTGTFNG